MLMASNCKVPPGRAEQVWELVQGPWDIKRECSHRAAPGVSTKQNQLLTRMKKSRVKRNVGSQLQGKWVCVGAPKATPSCCFPGVSASTLLTTKKSQFHHAGMLEREDRLLTGWCHPLLYSRSLLVAAELSFSCQHLHVFSAASQKSAPWCVWKVSEKEREKSFCLSIKMNNLGKTYHFTTSSKMLSGLWAAHLDMWKRCSFTDSSKLPQSGVLGESRHSQLITLSKNGFDVYKIWGDNQDLVEKD